MKKNRRKLPYQGTLVHDMPKEKCFECKHYGCTDSIETECMGFEKAGKITIMFRNFIKKVIG